LINWVSYNFAPGSRAPPVAARRTHVDSWTFDEAIDGGQGVLLVWT
jgi:hypothetical protein